MNHQSTPKPLWQHGLVLGKFMPLHVGHVQLLQFAQHQVQQLHVAVDHLAEEAFDGATRCAWIEETLPHARVHYLPHPMPQQPDEHSDFWNHWCAALHSAIGCTPNVLFASEAYGIPLAQHLGCTFQPFDQARRQFPIQATQLRTDLTQHWNMLAPAAKATLCTRICITGPESSGKTTLAKSLAAHYDTAWVPEYARQFIETCGTPTLSDMERIARGQQTLEAMHARHANRLLFCDTDALTTTIWSQRMHGQCPPALQQLAMDHHYDLYLLTAPDLPWQPDQVRYYPDEGEWFFTSLRQQLQQLQRPYAIIHGTGDARLQCAIQAINAHIKNII